MYSQISWEVNDMEHCKYIPKLVGLIVNLMEHCKCIPRLVRKIVNLMEHCKCIPRLVGKIVNLMEQGEDWSTLLIGRVPYAQASWKTHFYTLQKYFDFLISAKHFFCSI